jgi:hypothetical protein
MLEALTNYYVHLEISRQSMQLCIVLNVPKCQSKYKMLTVAHNAGILRSAMQCSSVQYRRVNK